MPKEIIDEVSAEQLTRGYWLLTHQEQIKKYLKIFLAALGGILWLFTFYQLIIYLVQLPQDRQIMTGILANQIDFTAYQERSRPQPLVYGSPQLIPNGSRRYDFVASVTNPNPKRGVTRLEYRFSSGNFVTATGTAIILPGQKTYLISLANQSPSALSGANLEIISEVWEPLRGAGQYQPPLAEITEIQTLSDEKSGRFMVSFLARNLTVDNFWTADFLVILWNNERVAGVNRLTLDQFRSGEAISGEISWFDPLARVSRVEVVPSIDVFDLNNRFTEPGQVQEL